MSELNKKLAEWAGFEPMYDREDGHKYVAIWLEPNGLTAQGGCPNFTESLDACFKWLVPKLSQYSFYWVRGRETVRIAAGVLRPKQESVYSIEGKEPALALCLAIEKLIGGGE